MGNNVVINFLKKIYLKTNNIIKKKCGVCNTYTLLCIYEHCYKCNTCVLHNYIHCINCNKCHSKKYNFCNICNECVLNYNSHSKNICINIKKISNSITDDDNILDDEYDIYI
jgi:hypothetical protein